MGAYFSYCVFVFDMIELAKQLFNGVSIMDLQKKKMIAPIIISAIFVLYYIIYFVFLIALLEGAWRYALGIVPLLLSAVMIYVCVDRIKEIKKGEEDDISKY